MCDVGCSSDGFAWITFKINNQMQINNNHFLYLLLVFFVQSATELHAQFHERSEVFVWAGTGLNLRETVDPNSKVIMVIPFGEAVTVGADQYAKDIYINLIKGGEQGDCRFGLTGKMINVNYKSINGYVYSGYLSRIDPTFNFFDRDIDSSINKNVMLVKEFGGTEGDNKLILYKQGYMRKLYSVYFVDDVYYLQDMSFQEGILLMKRMLTGNEIKFEEGCISSKGSSEGGECYDQSALFIDEGRNNAYEVKFIDRLRLLLICNSAGY